MTPVDPRTPCLVGVARRTWHPSDVGPEGSPEPLAMWEEVVRSAARDCGRPEVLSRAGSLTVVYNQSWSYDDAAVRLADRLTITPRHTRESGIGGSVPLVAVAEAAEAISRGELDVGIVVGAEALATVRRAKKEERKLDWSFRPAERRPFPFDVPFHPAEVAHGIFEAYLTFAIFDNARRAHLKRSLMEHRDITGRLLSPMTRTAAADPLNAWFPLSRTPHDIVDATVDNRMVAFPYTKLMTAIMDVDMAAAVIVVSQEAADSLAVPEDRRVYLRGWGYAEDPPYVGQRAQMWRSAAMAVASSAALDAARVEAGAIDEVDLYSCFASSVAFALDALGLPEDDYLDSDSAAASRSVTVTGGLPYHGGPGSNYLTHSMAAMVERLRARPASHGLVSGVGMHMMKHAYGVLSTTPGPFRPCDRVALSRRVEADQAVLPLLEAYSGGATIAGYSVLHGRDGSATSAVLVCDVPGGSRCYARLDDLDSVARAEEVELVGAPVQLAPGSDTVTAAQIA